MNKFNSNQKIGDIVAKFPKVADVFQEYKIDFCCGGDRPLIIAIKEQNLNEGEIIDKINKLYESFEKSSETDWAVAPLDELVEHILNKHHGYLWDELPNISKLTTLILRVHGSHHPELNDVHKLFHTLKMELESHLTKEETLQYPAIKEYVKSNSQGDLEKANKIIDDLEKEHTDAGNILKKLRKVTDDYAIPDDVCETYEKTYKKLEELEADLFQHIHLENNILFPRLKSLEK